MRTGRALSADQLYVIDKVRKVQEAVNKGRLTTSAQLLPVAGDPAKGDRIGLITRKRMQQQADDMLALGILPSALPLDNFVRFDFLPAEYQALVEK